MYKIFDTLEQYNQFTDNGTHLTAGILYLVKENKSLYFLTNNIDGEAEKYEYLDEIPEGYIIPTGNIEITENGENINVNDYATASVNVPIPEGYIKPSGNKTITQNGTNIDVNNYATATVNVPQPTGNISITENGENIDIAQYATATVNVASSAKDYIVEGAVYDPTATYSGYFNAEKQIVGVDIPSGFTSFGFNQLSKLEYVNYPNTVTTIGKIYSCPNFKRLNSNNDGELIISDWVTTLSSDSLEIYSNLTFNKLYIGSSVASIPNGFCSLNGLNTIEVSNQNTHYDSRNNCNAIIDTSTNKLILASNSTTVIPNDVTSIEYKAFQNCSSLTSVTIPDSVTTIGNYGISVNSTKWHITKIEIGSGVTSMGNYACGTNSGIVLSHVDIICHPTTPPTAGTFIFSNLTNLTIYVPAESVEAYKTATNWSAYASKIQAIA